MNSARIQGALAGLLMAALFGAITMLPSLQSAVDGPARRYIWIGYVLGVLFSSAAAFVWFGVAEHWLKRFGFNDGLAIGAFIGTLAVPVAPIIIKRITKAVTGPSKP